eukprot:1160763-Pelagomonas_calceolata.AAC.12
MSKVNEQQGGRSSYSQSAPAPHHSAPPTSSPSSRSSSTRAEHGRSCEEKSSKRRPRQPSLSAQDGTGN